VEASEAARKREPAGGKRLSRLLTRLKRTENPSLRYLLLRMRGAAHYATKGHLVSRQAVAAYLGATPQPCLQIGSGPLSIPEWLNSDLIAADIYLDVSRPLPLPDASFSYVFGEHQIEHLSEPAAERLLRELHRILRPGGVARLTTPDLQKIVAIYEDRNAVVARAEYGRYLDAGTGKTHERPAQILNDFLLLWGHRYVYDEEDLSARLVEAGFTDVVRRAPGESDHEALRHLERHGTEEWVNHAEAMCLEAQRPTSDS